MQSLLLFIQIDTDIDLKKYKGEIGNEIEKFFSG